MKPCFDRTSHLYKKLSCRRGRATPRVAENVAKFQRQREIERELYLPNNGEPFKSKLGVIKNH